MTTLRHTLDKFLKESPISLRHIHSNFTKTHPDVAYAGITPNLYVLPAGVKIGISYYVDDNKPACASTETISFVCKKPLLICIDYLLTSIDDDYDSHIGILTYPGFVIYNNKIINPEQFKEFDGKNVFNVGISYEGNEKYIDNAIYLEDNIECNKIYGDYNRLTISADDIHNLFNLCNYMSNS